VRKLHAVTQAFDYVNGSDAADLNPDDAGAYDGLDAEGYSPDDAGAYDGVDTGFSIDDLRKFSPLFQPSTGGVLGTIAKGVGAVGRGVEAVGHAAQSAAHAVTDNPIWDIAQTGISFIPGVGTAVSAGMASAAAIGRGASLADVGLAAAKGSLPGGPITAAALDMAVGAIQGHNLGDTALKTLRSQIPGGDLAKGAFDAGVAIMRNMTTSEVERIRANQTPAARQSFDSALAAHRNPQADAWAKLAALSPAQQKDLVAWQTLANLTPDQQRQLVASTKKRSLVRMKAVPRSTRPANPVRPFPHLPGAANRVASHMIANPALRAQNVQRLASSVPNVDERDVKKAIAAFLTRFNSTRVLDWRDVGELDSIDSCGRRCGIDVPNDLGEWPEDTGALPVVQLPRIGVSRSLLHSMYRKGDANIKKAILSHGLLAHIARNTGELSGTTWTIQSGDSPWKVTQTLTGDGNRWKEIAKVNPNMPVINNGTALKGWFVGRSFQIPPSWAPTVMPLPATSPLPAPVAVVATRPGGPPFRAPSEYPNGYPSSVYVVRSGDTGEKIATRIVGDKSRWRELLTTNPKKASSQYGIAVYTGDRLTLPSLWVQASPSPQVILQTTPSPVLPAPPGNDVLSLPAAMPAEAMPQPTVITLPNVTVTPSPAPATSSAAPAGPAVIASHEQLGVLQTMLASFFRHHVDASYSIPGPVFGSTAEDFAGVWNTRTQMAVGGFQKWWNGQGQTPLHTDGYPDEKTIQALVVQTNADNPSAVPASTSSSSSTTAATSPAPAAKKSGGDIGPLLLLAAPFLLG
jgi:nucleoid-associated protein YgaU